MVAFSGEPPAVALDGNHIAYVTTCQGEAIMLANADGSQPISIWSQPMTGSISDLAWGPAASPEPGEYLTFVAQRSGEPYLYILSIHPTMTTFYPTLSNQAGYAEPAWSPDSRRLAFLAPSHSEDREVESQLYVLDVDSRDVARPLDLVVEVFSPQWSPDGERIAFVAEVPGKGTDIYTVRPDDSLPKQLTATQRPKQDLAWSPDGTTLAFSGETTEGKFDIFLINSEGTEQSQIVTTENDLVPTWSPDGQWIAFVSERPDLNVGELYLAPVAGGTPVRVTDQPLTADWVAWVPLLSQKSEQVTIRGVVAEFSMTERPTTITLEQPVAGYRHIQFREAEVAGTVQDTGQEEPGIIVQTSIVTRDGFGTTGPIQPGTTVEVTGQAGQNDTLIADTVRLPDVEVPCR